MKKPNVHDPEYWLCELRPLLDEIHFAFQTAMPTALKYFDEFKKKPVNGPVLSNLVRYEVLEYLKGHGISAREEAEPIDMGPLDGCEMNSLPNNGIELLYRGSCIRLRKGLDAPRPTTPTQEEWYQQVLPFEVDEDGESQTTFTNLLILWYSTDIRTFAGLKLLRTKGVTKKSVLYDWARVVDAPYIPISSSVQPQYSKDPDLPLDPLKKFDESEGTKGTGTDDH